MKFGNTNPSAVKPRGQPIKDMGTGNPPFRPKDQPMKPVKDLGYGTPAFVDKTKPLPQSMPRLRDFSPMKPTQIEPVVRKKGGKASVTSKNKSSPKR